VPCRARIDHGVPANINPLRETPLASKSHPLIPARHPSRTGEQMVDLIRAMGLRPHGASDAHRKECTRHANLHAWSSRTTGGPALRPAASIKLPGAVRSSPSVRICPPQSTYNAGSYNALSKAGAGTEKREKKELVRRRPCRRLGRIRGMADHRRP